MPRPASLSPELLQTFVTLHQTEGDAAQAAEILGINQPSMSKRLAQLQHAGRILKRPWLERLGKRWLLTDEGERVLPAVQDLLHRYEQLKTFVAGAAPSGLHFACGREGVTGFVLEAVKRFRREHPQTRIRLATLRGEQRIEGVASGGAGPGRGGPRPRSDPGHCPPALAGGRTVRRSAGPGLSG